MVCMNSFIFNLTRQQGTDVNVYTQLHRTLEFALAFRLNVITEYTFECTHLLLIEETDIL